MISQPASRTDPLGYDVKIGADLDPSGRSAAGHELVADAILHRLEQDQLLLTGAPDDQIDFGVDVRRWIGEATTDDAIAAKVPQLEEVVRRDPRIASATVTITRVTGETAARYKLLIRVQAITVVGQIIDRIVGVSAVTVEFLAQGR
jgi:hypothetical protein